jgi:hypothetical protein
MPNGVNFGLGLGGYDVVVTKNTIFAIGGSDTSKSGGGPNGVSRLTVVDGSLTKFTKLVNPLFNLLGTTVVTKNSIYVLGGTGPTASTADVYRASFDGWDQV